MPWVPVSKAGAKAGVAPTKSGEEKDDSKATSSTTRGRRGKGGKAEEAKTIDYNEVPDKKKGGKGKESSREKSSPHDDWRRGHATMGKFGERTRASNNTSATDWSEWAVADWAVAEWDEWAADGWAIDEWAVDEWATNAWGADEWAVDDWDVDDWGGGAATDYWTGGADWSTDRGREARDARNRGKGGKKGEALERSPQSPTGKGKGKGKESGKGGSGKDSGKGDYGKDSRKGSSKGGKKGKLQNSGAEEKPQGMALWYTQDEDGDRDIDCSHPKALSQLVRPRNEATRQAKEEHGQHCTVKKHSSMGCAVVTMNDSLVRKAILKAGPELAIDGFKVKVKAHVDKDTGRELANDLFVGWGHQAERSMPLLESDLVRFFDAKHEELHGIWLKEQDQMAQVLSVGRAQRQKMEVDEARREAARKTNELQGMWAQGQLRDSAALAQKQRQLEMQQQQVKVEMQRQQQAVAAAQYSPQYQQQLAAHYAYQQQVQAQQQQQQQLAAYYAHLRVSNPQQYQQLQLQQQQQQQLQLQQLQQQQLLQQHQQQQLQ